MRFALGPCLVVRRLEALPENLALGARNVGRLPPLLLQIANVAHDLVGIVEAFERLHLLAELLLDPDVGPSLPVGDVAQFLDLRRERRLRGLQPLDDLLVVLARRQRRNGAERRPQIAQRAVARFEREIFARPERFDARRQLLEPGERVAPRALILLLNGRFPGGELRVGIRVARGEIRIDGDAAADIGPFAAHHAELSPRRRQIVDARRARRFVGELREPRLTPLGVLARGVIGRFAARPRLRFLRLAARRRRFFLRARPFGSREPLRLLARPLLVLGGARLCRQPRGPFRRFRFRCRSRRSRRLLSRALVGLAQDAARPLRGALVLRAARNLFQLGSIREALHGRRRRLAELAVQHHAEHLEVIVERLERRPPYGFVLRMTRDRSEHVLIAVFDRARKRAMRGRFARRALGHYRQRSQIADGIDRRQAFRFADPLERLERNVAQHRGRLGANALVAVARCDDGERTRIEQLRHRGAPHARVGIFARHLGEQLVVGQRDLLNEGEPDRRVRMLLARLRAKPI